MDTRKYRPRLRVLSVISTIALLILAIITVGLANSVGSIVQQRNSDSFTWDTSQVTDRIQDSLSNYSSVLYSGRGLLITNPNTSQQNWNDFYNSQDVFHRYMGISSVSYVQIVPASQKASFIAQEQADPSVGAAFTINPPGNRPSYLVGTLVDSTSNMGLNGFDAYSTADRKAVYDQAQATGQPVASPQINLSTGAAGMFVALPVNQGYTTAGFVDLTVHSADFFPALVQPNELNDISLRITDITDSKNQVQLYSTGDWSTIARDQVRSDTITFAGRTWKIDYRASPSFAQKLTQNALPRVILLAGLLLICVLLMSSYIIFKTAPRPKNGHGNSPTSDLE